MVATGVAKMIVYAPTSIHRLNLGTGLLSYTHDYPEYILYLSGFQATNVGNRVYTRILVCKNREIFAFLSSYSQAAQNAEVIYGT